MICALQGESWIRNISWIPNPDFKRFMKLITNPVKFQITFDFLIPAYLMYSETCVQQPPLGVKKSGRWSKVIQRLDIDSSLYYQYLL